MIDYKTNVRLFDAVMYFLAVCVIVILITSCSPYVEVPATAAPSATATARMVAIATEPTPSPSCTVTAQTLNFREGPGMSYAVTGILRQGERLEVIARGAWLRVSTGTETGYIYGRYCQ